MKENTLPSGAPAKWLAGADGRAALKIRKIIKITHKDITNLIDPNIF